MKKLFKHLSQVEETSNRKNHIHDLNNLRLFEEAKKAYYKNIYL